MGVGKTHYQKIVIHGRKWDTMSKNQETNSRSRHPGSLGTVFSNVEQIDQNKDWQFQ
jgi:hypothetical protein